MKVQGGIKAELDLSSKRCIPSADVQKWLASHIVSGSLSTLSAASCLVGITTSRSIYVSNVPQHILQASVCFSCMHEAFSREE